MTPAERGDLAAHTVKLCFPRAGIRQATFAADVHHAVLGVLAAVDRPLAAIDVISRQRCAGIPCTKPADDVHHALLSILLAEYRPLAVFHFKEWPSRAGIL